MIYENFPSFRYRPSSSTAEHGRERARRPVWSSGRQPGVPPIGERVDAGDQSVDGGKLSIDERPDGTGLPDVGRTLLPRRRLWILRRRQRSVARTGRAQFSFVFVRHLPEVYLNSLNANSYPALALVCKVSPAASNRYLAKVKLFSLNRLYTSLIARFTQLQSTFLDNFMNRTANEVQIRLYD